MTWYIACLISVIIGYATCERDKLNIWLIWNIFITAVWFYIRVIK